MCFTTPGLSEAALAAHFEYLCALKGSERPAYVSVVASGANALVIHYTSNNQILSSGDLVLVDAGCELRYVWFSYITQYYMRNETCHDSIGGSVNYQAAMHLISVGNLMLPCSNHTLRPYPQLALGLSREHLRRHRRNCTR